MLVAVVALVMAMAGTGYAAAKISGLTIKKRSMPANRIVLDTVTGDEVDESTLGQVPSAQNALTAQQAANADTVGNHKPADFVPSQRVLRIKLAYNVPSGSGAEATAECLPGEVALSGGGAWYVHNTDTTVGSGSTLATSAPLIGASNEFDSWRAEGRNDAGVPRDFRAWVVCAQA
jgi:hypothetical protein